MSGTSVHGIPLAHTATLLGALAVAVAVFALFRRWERRGQAVLVVQTIVGALVLDAALYPDTVSTQQVGLFHPSFGGQNFRITQLLLLAALVAKLSVRGLPRRVDGPSLWWTAFFAWYATAAVAGLMYGHDSHLVVSRAYLIVEAGGLLLLVAAVPMAEWLDDRGLPRLLRFAGVVAAANFALGQASLTFDAHLPYFPLSGTGKVGADAATIYLSLGLLGLAMEMSRPKRRLGVLLASLVLVLSHAGTAQRAARLDLAVSLLVFLGLLLWPRRRRFLARGGELAVAGLVVAALIATPVFLRAVRDTGPTAVTEAVPLLNSSVYVASPNYRQGSVDSRFNEWQTAGPLIREQPLLGQGLGTTFTHYDIGTRSWITFDITNNIWLDLLLRSGAVGLALFVMALATTIAGAWRAWRRSPLDEAALLAAMTLAVLVGYVAKGQVESVLNEYRMTPLLGLLAGLALSAARSYRSTEPPA